VVEGGTGITEANGKASRRAEASWDASQKAVCREKTGDAAGERGGTWKRKGRTGKTKRRAGRIEQGRGGKVRWETPSLKGIETLICTKD